ncbi:MAG TPA: protein translocase subunit SecF [Thermomicrobiales bacterium]|nr:protein translocase subunit SecF [Thermomicrobiales bacterium]
MRDLARRRNLWYLISAILLLPGIISLIFNGLELGIDFTGGSVWEIRYTEEVNTSEIREVLVAEGRTEAQVQQVGDPDENRYQIRLRELAESSPEKERLTEALETLAPLDPEAEALETIGASVGTSIRNRSLLAVGAASVGVLLYIAWAFRNTGNPLLYGTAAIVAMLHDALFVLGVFSILGVVADVEIDALFVTALLTVIGFSVHDTIVVFDRMRENRLMDDDASMEEIVNRSLVQTLVRSLNTSITVIFTLAALLVFGGESTRNFVLALLIGMIAGTYSSIFNAAQLLVSWNNGEIQQLFRRVARRPDPGAEPVEA